jgi:hypothetical protein
MATEINFGPSDPSLPQGVRDVLSSAQRKQPTNAFELWMSQNPKGSAEDYLQLESEGKNKPLDQQLIDAETAGDTGKANTIRRVIRETKVDPRIAIQQPREGPHQMVYVDNGDGTQRAVDVRPGMTISGNASKTPGGPKIGADEQKRADLARNLNENIDSLEDILTRRRDLFGPLAGRLTQAKSFLGSDDPDVAKLMSIEHQLGMVAQGAHGMRSAQGVESAAQALTNGFKNSPEATRAALEVARKSVATFLSDAQAPGQARTAGGAGDMIQVQIPGHAPGSIPRSALKQFQAENPNARVVQ